MVAGPDSSFGVLIRLLLAATLTMLAGCVRVGWDVASNTDAGLDLIPADAAVDAPARDAPGDTLRSADAERDAGPSTPTVSWAVNVGGPAADQAWSVGTDSAGNVYLAGRFQGTLTHGLKKYTSVGSNDVLVASFSAAGAPRWAVAFGSQGDDWPHDLVVAPSGDSYLTGRVSGKTSVGGDIIGELGQSDLMLVGFTPLGVRFARGLGGSGQDVGRSLALGPTGAIYLLGDFTGTANFGGAPMPSSGMSDMVLARYTSMGSYSWVVRLGGSQTERGVGLSLGQNGGLFVLGQFSGSTTLGSGVIASKGGYDICLAKYNVSSTYQWSKGFGSPNLDVPYAVAVDAAENIYVSGRFKGAIDLGMGPLADNDYAGFIGSFTTAGAPRWSRSVSKAHHRAVVVDANSNLWATGSLFGDVNLGGATLPGSSAGDIFAASYTSAGVHRWSRAFGGPAAENAVSLAGHASGALYVVGDFIGPLSFGSKTLTSKGLSDIFLLKLTR